MLRFKKYADFYGSQKELLMVKRVVSITLITILGVVMLAACSVDPEKAIIGEWQCNDENVDSNLFLYAFTFDENGTFFDNDGDTGNWSIEVNSNNVISLILDYEYFETMIIGLSFMGNNRVTMLRNDENGESAAVVTLHRK